LIAYAFFSRFLFLSGFSLLSTQDKRGSPKFTPPTPPFFFASLLRFREMVCLRACFVKKGLLAGPHFFSLQADRGGRVIRQAGFPGIREGKIPFSHRATFNLVLSPPDCPRSSFQMRLKLPGQFLPPPSPIRQETTNGPASSAL